MQRLWAVRHALLELACRFKRFTSLRYAHLAPNQAVSNAVMVLDKFNGEAQASA
jgi:hypothetical protein